MYCPQCGQQQVSDVTRFCSRCGFPLDGAAAVLASGGALPTGYQPGYQQMSPRSKGIRQGALLMLSTLLIVPLVAIVSAVAILPIMPAVMRAVDVGSSINDRRPVIYDRRRAMGRGHIDHRRRRQAHRCSHHHPWGRLPDDNVRQWRQRQAEVEINSARMRRSHRSQ